MKKILIIMIGIFFISFASAGEVYTKEFLDTPYYVKESSISSDNTFKSEFLYGAYFDLKYDIETEEIKTLEDMEDKIYGVSNDDEEISFYKIDKAIIQDTTNIRYINRSVISNSEMMVSYALFEYSSNSVPTISSYIPDKGYVFYGTRDYYRDLKVENEYEISRQKAELGSTCPVLISNRNAIVIEFHKKDLDNKNVDNFYKAIIRAIKDYGITNIKESDFYVAESLIYYMDGIQPKQIGRLTRNGDTITFFLYVEGHDEKMFTDLTFSAKLSQNFITKLGSLKDLNEDIDFSIKEKIVEYFLEEEGYTSYLSGFTSEEEDIKYLLSLEFEKDFWLIDGQWGSPFIEKEKESYEYSVILKTKPTTNIVEFDIETDGLDFYYQAELTPQEKINGDFRPSNIIGSYAVYYDGTTNARGKVMNIYRPKVIDAENNWEWAELNINENTGKLRITINQKFLDTAVYPILVDPTLGYTTVGGSFFPNNVASSNIKGTVWAGVDGTVQNMSAHIWLKEGDEVYIRGAIYENDTGNLVEETEPIVEKGSAAPNYLRIMPFSSPPTINLGTDYILCVSTNYLPGSSDDVYLYYDELGSNQIGIVNDTYSGNTTMFGYPNNLLFTTNNRTYSIYVNYTETSPPPSGNITNQLSLRNSHFILRAKHFILKGG